MSWFPVAFGEPNGLHVFSFNWKNHRPMRWYLSLKLDPASYAPTHDTTPLRHMST